MDLFFIDFFYTNYQLNKKIEYFSKDFLMKFIWDNTFFINSFNTPHIFGQEQINRILFDFALFFKDNANFNYISNVRKFKKETIRNFNVGSTHVIFDDKKKTQEFINTLIEKKYNKQLIKSILSYFLKIGECLDKKYNCKYSTSFPDISNNECKGIVLRTEGYTVNDDGKDIRNIYKFFVTNPNSYLLNSDCLKNNKKIFIVEGVFDLLSLYEIGIFNVITMSSTRFSRDNIDLLKDKEISLVFDMDLGGLVGLEYFYENFHSIVNKVSYFQLDVNNLKDIDEARIKNPNELINFFKEID